jgi:hypothetical protein
MVVYLASDQCDRTHRYYSAIRGRYAEIFVAVNDGWVAPAGEPPTAEELAVHQAQLRCVGERGSARLRYWKVLATELRCQPERCTAMVKAVLALH